MVDFENLKITPEHWQTLFARDPIAPFIIDGVRGIYLRQRQYWPAIALTEISIFLLMLIVVLPLVLMTAHHQALDGTTDSLPLLRIVLGIAAIAWLVVNGVLVERGMSLWPLVQLHCRIEQYNQIIETLAFTAALPGQNAALADATLWQTLETIHASLLKSLQMEQLSRDRAPWQHHQLIVAQLDAQLDTLLRQSHADATTTTAQLLQEALDLGLAVHREVRQWQNR